MSELTEEQIAEIRSDLGVVEDHVGHGEAQYNGPALCALSAARKLLAEVERLKAELANEEREHGQTIRDRDAHHEAADELAAIIATLTGTDIGEHSNMNDPWRNAIEAGESMIAAELREIIRVFASTAPEFEAKEALRVRVAELEARRACTALCRDVEEGRDEWQRRAEAMTPVVEAAKAWRLSLDLVETTEMATVDGDGQALLDAVDTYNAGRADDELSPADIGHVTQGDLDGIAALTNIVGRDAARPLDEEPDPHRYLSTACLHGLHDKCRLECKYCGQKCSCGGADGCAGHTNTSEEVPTWAEADKKTSTAEGSTKRRYHQRPVYWAVQWQGDNAEEVTQGRPSVGYLFDVGGALRILINHHDGTQGWMQVDVGDWIVEEGAHGWTVYSDYMFRLQHEVVPDGSR